MAPNSKILRVIISVFDWYPKSYPKEERRLLMKLDRAILVFGCLSFFCRFLGQQNITNAYVSGMEEDLNATGNELNYYNVAYNTAYVLGQIPLMTLQTKPKIAPFLLPTLQIFWAIIAFAQSTVTQNWHLYLLRAITGFLEASSFGGTHLILGSWYKNDELFKRAGVWFMGNSLGSMFSGYLQSAIRSGLGGVAGRSAWQWLFIVQGIITLPICILGYLFWPGLPSSPKRWYFTDEDHALAVKRIYHVEHEGITWKTFKYTLSRPMWWIAVPCYIMLVQAHYWTGYMALYLKAAGYSGNLRVILPTFIDLIRALSSWLGTTLAGVLSVRSLFTFQATLVIFAIICLTVWYIPDPLKFTAFYLGGFSGMASPILYSFVNTQLKESYGERGLVISSMMTLGFCSQIWVPLFTFPTVQAPRFPNGYPACIAFEFAMWAILMFGIWYMKGYHLRHPVPETGSDVAIVRPSSDAQASEDGDTDGDAKSEKDAQAVSPGRTTPSDSVYRLDAEKLDSQGGIGAVEVETERKNVDVGFAAGVGDGVPVAYDVALGEEAQKQAAGERR